MPRPQTVAKIELGDRLLGAFAGSENGVRMMKASEWEPIIRYIIYYDLGLGHHYTLLYV